MLATATAAAAAAAFAEAALPSAAAAAIAAEYDDGFGAVRGVGDPDLLALLSYARRSLGELDGSGAIEAEFQTLPQLYSGGMGGLLEGPTWGAYWTQNRCDAPAGGGRALVWRALVWRACERCKA
jgi:hypothetical protein